MQPISPSLWLVVVLGKLGVEGDEGGLFEDGGVDGGGAAAVSAAAASHPEVSAAVRHMEVDEEELLGAFRQTGASEADKRNLTEAFRTIKKARLAPSSDSFRHPHHEWEAAGEDYILDRGIPYIVGGDWNMEPGELRSGLHMDILHGAFRFDPNTQSHIYDGGQGSSNIDYYLISRALDVLTDDAA
eukprot:7477408-Pyramimonas_sp.AAC.1